MEAVGHRWTSLRGKTQTEKYTTHSPQAAVPALRQCHCSSCVTFLLRAAAATAAAVVAASTKHRLSPKLHDSQPLCAKPAAIHSAELEALLTQQLAATSRSDSNQCVLSLTHVALNV
jgi:hypothetical protein